MDKETFESLNTEEQSKIFHEISFREKGELLFYSHSPQELTQSLAPEELLLVTQELDLEERSEIIRYANLPQLLFLSDVECWKGDRINPKGFIYWLETLLADETRLLAWFDAMDYETIVASFGRFVKIAKREWEFVPDEMLGDTPYFTLDEYYFVFVDEENLETVKRVLEVLFENRRGRYAAVLEGVMNELEDELEEEAYRQREMRLGERGFVSPEAARQIYRPISEKEFESFPMKDEGREGKARTFFRHSKAPNYPLLWSPDRLFLDEVLLRFTEEDLPKRDSLQEELVWLSNKVIASTKIDFASEEVIREGIARARFFVSVGLEDLSEKNPEKAAKILNERWVEIIFRWGFGLLLKLREAAQGIVREIPHDTQKVFLDALDIPYGLLFQGLLKTVPVFPVASEGKASEEYRDFRSLADAEWAETRLTEVRLVFGRFAKEIVKGLEPGSSESVAKTFFGLLGTFFAGFVANGKRIESCLKKEALVLFLREAFENRDGKRVLIDSRKEEFLNTFFSESERRQTAFLWDRVFQNLEEELGGLDPSAKIDRRFVSALCVS
ncbi:MAG TPA: DUF6178 family protein [Candidatus Omnitrophota bacterium]|nr:DUF6178 family protein [Candidatus Omnitrophota bacterium]